MELVEELVVEELVVLQILLVPDDQPKLAVVVGQEPEIVGEVDGLETVLAVVHGPREVAGLVQDNTGAPVS